MLPEVLPKFKWIFSKFSDTIIDVECRDITNATLPIRMSDTVSEIPNGSLYELRT